MFILEKKIIFDGQYEDIIKRCAVRSDSSTDFTRFHVTQLIRDNIPQISAVEKTNKVHFIDFAFYILQGNAKKDGFVPVPINQQMNDLRAENLTLMPGNDRKRYRSTDIVPRDGIDIGGFLPRSVTITYEAKLKDPYKFSVTFPDSPLIKIQFTPETAKRIYDTKIVTLLIEKDPNFIEKNNLYQKLCASYFEVFPEPVVAPVVVKPKPTKEDVLAKSEQAMIDLEEGMRNCKTCELRLNLDRFEVNRQECKTCRQKRKTNAAHNAEKPEERPPMPTICRTCGKGGQEFKWRTDVVVGSWRTSCNACYNSKGYSEKSRALARDKDEYGYLARNAATHLIWAHKNPDKVKEQQIIAATIPERKIKTILNSANYRNISFDKNDIEILKNMLVQECAYCGFQPSDIENLNGLDRVDSNLGYSASNTVSCCATCNAMKGCIDVDVFIDNVRRIINHRHIQFEDNNRSRLPPFSGRTDLREVKKIKNITNIPIKIKKIMLLSNCYLCNNSPAFGIDRVDASLDYSKENCRPCCSDCNYMKKDLEIEIFENHLSHIHERTKTWILKDVMDKNILLCSGKVRQPIAAIDNNTGITLMIFPSMNIAFNILGKSCNCILREATSRQFKEQKIDDPFKILSKK